MVPKVVSPNASIQNVFPFPYRKIILKISYVLRKWGWGEGGDKVVHLVGKCYLAFENNFEGYKGFLPLIVSLQGLFSEAARSTAFKKKRKRKTGVYISYGNLSSPLVPPTDKKEKNPNFLLPVLL